VPDDFVGKREPPRSAVVAVSVRMSAFGCTSDPVGRLLADRERMVVVYAVTSAQPGGPEVLTWSRVDDPECGPDEVLIDVAASAVNRADLLQRAGFYPPPPGAAPYLGLECSGRIASVGRDVSQWQPGDEVCALLAGGGYAQQVAVPAGQVLPVPAGVSLVHAASLPEAACTVWSNLFDVAHLGPLDTVLIHGGGSGIGTFAIQLAAAHGARVITTARAEKHEALRDLGAEVTIDYRTEDFPAAVRVATGGRGADVVLDIIGAGYLGQNIDTLATGGRLVIIGLQGGNTAEINLGTMLAKRCTVVATALRPRPVAEKAEIIRSVREHVWPLIERGLVRPVIFTELPMTQAGQAHRLVESSQHTGKVLLVAEPV
jgi:putative PIG3 family NAD(P)H quinone oxidoreductase